MDAANPDVRSASGSPAHRAGKLHHPARDLRNQLHGDVQRPGVHPPACQTVRRRGNHQRQVLREPRAGTGVTANAMPWAATIPIAPARERRSCWVSSYRRSFFPADQCHRHGVKIATARAGNVIGGGDWARDRIVPDIVRHLASSRAVPVRSPWAVASVAGMFSSRCAAT